MTSKVDRDEAVKSEFREMLNYFEKQEKQFQNKTELALAKMGNDDLKDLYWKAANFLKTTSYQNHEIYEHDLNGYGIEKWQIVDAKPTPFKRSDYRFFTAYTLQYSDYANGYVSSEHTIRLEQLPSSLNKGEYDLTDIVGYTADGIGRNISWNSQFNEWFVRPSKPKMETYTAFQFENWHETDFQSVSKMVLYCKSDTFKQLPFEEKIKSLSALLKELDYTGAYPNRKVFPVYQEYVSDIAKASGISIKWDKVDDNKLWVSRQKYLSEMAVERRSRQLSHIIPQYISDEGSQLTALQRILRSKESLEKAYPHASIEKVMLSVSTRLDNRLTEKETEPHKINIKL